jgi:hypothetical protein
LGRDGDRLDQPAEAQIRLSGDQLPCEPDQQERDQADQDRADEEGVDLRLPRRVDDRAEVV